jgi:hypothetical protein
MVFYGKGGYDWNTIYNIPIWLRKFVFNKIHEHYDNESKSSNQDNNVQKSIEAMKIAGFTKDKLQNQSSNQSPHYTTKASKK